MSSSRGMNSTKFCTGRLRSDVQPLTVLYTIFDRKGTLLVLAIIGITPRIRSTLFYGWHYKLLQSVLWYKSKVLNCWTVDLAVLFRSLQSKVFRQPRQYDQVTNSRWVELVTSSHPFIPSLVDLPCMSFVKFSPATLVFISCFFSDYHRSE